MTTLFAIESAIDDPARLREMFLELERDADADPLQREVMLGRVQRYLRGHDRLAAKRFVEEPVKALVRVPGYTRADGTRVGGYTYHREGGHGDRGVDAPSGAQDRTPEQESPDVFSGPKSQLFQDPYHTSPEKAASLRFTPLEKPTGATPEEIRGAAREKLGQTPVLLPSQIRSELKKLKTGAKHRFPEGTLVQRNASGDDNHFRVDGPDGTFWRVPLADAARLTEFEETTARANRFGETIPGNPMVPLPGVDVPGDVIVNRIGGVLHGGSAPLPRGTTVRRIPGEGGDTFELRSPTGTVRRFPATKKAEIIETARRFEREAEGKDGGEVKEPKPKLTIRAANPDGPLQPLPKNFQRDRIALHAESERVLGYSHGGNEVALVQTQNGFGTPSYVDKDGKTTRIRVEGTDTVLEKVDEPDIRDPIGPPPVDPKSAKQLADFFKLSDKVQRDLRDQGVEPDGEVTDVRFDAPILWPEHFDMAVELGKGTAKEPGNRAVYGASPGDESHPEPYFYVNPWAKKDKTETWNAEGFNGAELSYADVLASDDQEKTIRDFYLTHLRALGAEREEQDKPPAPLAHDKAIELYKGGYASVVNRHLRGNLEAKQDPDVKERAEQLVPALDEIIDEGPPVGNHLLYRGIDLNTAQALRANLAKGKHFSDAGFLSTTESEIIANNFASGAHDDPIVLKIKAPPETHTLAIDSADELERVLPRGGSFEALSDPYEDSYFGIKIPAIDVAWSPGA